MAQTKLILPRPDPPGHWRRATVDPATTTSRCVGSTSTPMCAVDTMEVCSIRGDDSLCRAGTGPDSLPYLIYEAPNKNIWTKYRIVSAAHKPLGKLRPRLQSFYQNWRDGNHPWPPGDVRIVIQRDFCYASRCDSRRAWDRPTTYLLQPTAEGWRVIDYKYPPFFLRLGEKGP